MTILCLEEIREIGGRVNEAFSLEENVDDEIKNLQIGFNKKYFKCSLKETVSKLAWNYRVGHNVIHMLVYRYIKKSYHLIY